MMGNLNSCQAWAVVGRWTGGPCRGQPEQRADWESWDGRSQSALACGRCAGLLLMRAPRFTLTPLPGYGPAAEPELLRTAEVAALMMVHPQTVKAWVKAGRLRYRRTPGGHHRFDPADIKALLVPVPAEQHEQAA